MADEVLQLPTPRWREVDERVTAELERAVTGLETVHPDKLTDLQGYIRALRFVARIPEQMMKEADMKREASNTAGYHIE